MLIGLMAEAEGEGVTDERGQVVMIAERHDG